MGQSMRPLRNAVTISGGITVKSLLERIEAWIASNKGYQCCRNYQPGFASLAADRREQCPGCLLTEVAYELRHSASSAPSHQEKP